MTSEEPRGRTVQAIAKEIEGARAHGRTRVKVRSVACDSRRVRAGALFCAIRGEHLDGHAFLDEALKRGAKAVLSEEAPQRDLPWITASDARRAMARAACLVYEHPSRRLKVLGVTGTNGKTTVVHLLGHMLRALGSPCGVLGTLGYDLDGEALPAENTTPQAPDLQEMLFQLASRSVPYAAMEVSSHALSLGRVEGTRFAGAVFTGLTRDHLDFHGSMKAYFEAKRRLFEALPEDAWAVLNADNEHAEPMQKACRGRTLTYGLDAGAQVRAESVSLALDGLRFDVVSPRGRRRIHSPLIGMPNVSNLLAASAAAEMLELPFRDALNALAQAPPVRGRFEHIRAQQGFDVLVDYAHTDDALRNLLRSARSLRPKRVLTVFGCGGDRDKGKRIPMGRAAGEWSDLVFLTSDNPRGEGPQKILEDVEPGVREFRAPGEYVMEADRRRAIKLALRAARPGDLVVVAGKGHETHQILADRTVAFDDQQVVEEILKTL
ncbi:MAG: UDP-N-acetylmuramoyl-L-alanyl-D-glutamate--2,6-diaminopimelate ligase [Acidobacteriota bacterium]|nr:MAG: UDP-N-acetylmuramoyl-L-alanyl-D-glutamate--2,6-diaminopimelate ligase [Acidobacteriota bacterium]